MPGEVRRVHLFEPAMHLLEMSMAKRQTLHGSEDVDAFAERPTAGHHFPTAASLVERCSLTLCHSTTQPYLLQILSSTREQDLFAEEVGLSHVGSCSAPGKKKRGDENATPK